jgi:hypothetical protein
VAIETIAINVDETNAGITATVVPSSVAEVFVDVVSQEGTTSIAPQVVNINYDVAYGLSGGGGVGTVALQEHIDSQTPHPAYDVDMMRLDILFENGLV